MHQKARCRPGLEQPCRAGIEVHADEVEGRAALLIALEGQRYVDQPCRQFGGKACLEQTGRQFCGEVAVHSGRASGAHAVAEDHLRGGRAAELLDRIAGDAAPRGAPGGPEDGPQSGLFAEEQGRHPLAGEHLGRVEGAAAEPPDLLCQCGQLRGRKPGAGQGDSGPRPAQVVQRDGRFQRRGAETGKKVGHPPGFIGFRCAGAAQLFAQHPQCVGHGAVLLSQGCAHGLGVDAGLLPAAVEREGFVHRCAERRRVDAAPQLGWEVAGLQMAVPFQNGPQGVHAVQRRGVFLLPAALPPPAVEAERIMGVVDDPAEGLAPVGQGVVDLVDGLREGGQAFGHCFQSGGRRRKTGPLLRCVRFVCGHRGQPAAGQQRGQPQPSPGAEGKAKGTAGRLEAEHSRHTAARIGGKGCSTRRPGASSAAAALAQESPAAAGPGEASAPQRAAPSTAQQARAAFPGPGSRGRLPAPCRTRRQGRPAPA